MAQDHDPDKPHPLVRAARFASVGLEMGVAVALGWALGAWLDRKLGTEPWLMLVCLLFGVAAGFKGMILAAREAMRAAAESSPQVAESPTQGDSGRAQDGREQDGRGTQP